MASQLTAIYNDLKSVADMANSIGSTISTIDGVASPIADALIASAAIGDEIGASLGGTYQDSIHPVAVTIADTCNQIHDFIYNVIGVLQQADGDASTIINAVSQSAGPLSSIF